MSQRILMIACVATLSLLANARGAEELVVEHGKPGFVLENGSARVFVTQPRPQETCDRAPDD